MMLMNIKRLPLGNSGVVRMADAPGLTDCRT